MESNEGLEWASLVLWALTALGSLILAVVAIWGDRIRSKLAPLKLEIELRNPRGTLVPTAGGRAIWYHLYVVNRTRCVSARNCRVLLAARSKRGPDGQFHPELQDVPRQFIWAPNEFLPALVTITKDQALDFGCVPEKDPKFIPLLYSVRRDLPGTVGKDEAIRYSLEIQADGFVSTRYTVVEVAWNGEWSDDLLTMEDNLRMRIVNEP